MQNQVFVIDRPVVGLVLTYTGDPGLWDPYIASDGTLVAIAGRVAPSEAQWQAAEMETGSGGLASKAVYQAFEREGLPALQGFGGNCVLLVHDLRNHRFHIITDAAGAFPAFRLDRDDKLVFGSHPDVLAAATGEQDKLDDASLTEFLLTSSVTPPHTYYQHIRALAPGTVTTIALAPGGAQPAAPQRYFKLFLQPDGQRGEDDLAEELAVALRNAVRRRTLPRLGRTAVALSGGLDSRVILACVENRNLTFAFSCYNQPNREFEVAQAIASALEVPFKAWQRPFEYYGDTAELGVRISGGMGTIANNHFLGIVDRLRAEGAQNLLTGCYCDYLFKGLPLNRRTHWLSGREQLAPFRHEFYFSHYLRPTPLAQQVRERLESRVPAEFQVQDSDAAVFQVEARRTFPLCYEADNQQRVVPQRVTGWSLPVADREVLEVYCKIPWRFKLNRSVFLKAARQLCQGTLARIPDANTGAPIGASALREAFSTTRLRLQRKFRRCKGSIATDGSWPDWYYYVSHSSKLQALWRRPNPQATDFFRRVLTPGDLRPDTTDYRGEEIWLLVTMLTLKLWFEQRVG